MQPIKLKVDPQVASKHCQIAKCSCIPMAVEYVLKLIGAVDPDYIELQKEWKNKRDGNFNDFDNRLIHGVCFHRQFPLERGNNFPIESLFKKIDSELEAHRFVIISLARGADYHNWLIHERLPNGEYRAITKGADPDCREDVRQTVQQMGGTDILIYEIDAGIGG